MTDLNDTSIKKALSINLRRIMKQKKIKSKDLAMRIGLSGPAISNYLAGKSGSTPDTLSKIAEALHVTVNDLICLPRTTLRENSDSITQYEVPLFSAILASSENVYRKDNFDGVYMYPHPAHGDYDCYVVKIYNNLLASSGMAQGSRVLFAANKEVKSGDFAAVLLKKEKQVVIRRVEFSKNKITLFTDNTSVSYPNTKKNSEIEILGYVVDATHSPNL